MANEIKINGYVVSKTLAFKVSNAAGQYWHVAGAAFFDLAIGGNGFDINIR